MARIRVIAGPDAESGHLKAKDISLPSRIMIIADIYDALSAPNRPYKSSIVPQT